MSISPFVALSSAIVESTRAPPSDARTASLLRDMPHDGRWLTYDELANMRGISRASARRLVQRNGWRQQHDDQQTVRILVPLDRWSPSMSDISAAFGNALAIIRDAHAGEIKALREQLVEARHERDQERERAEHAETAIAAERQRADTLEEQLRSANLAAREALEAAAQARWQVAEAQQLASLSIQADKPQEAMGRLRQEAMGRLRRLLSILRGDNRD